ncbi:hypothetical protein RSAG8_13777, partial [Rhizoctonia solani AG-8 WAC10335]
MTRWTPDLANPQFSRRYEVHPVKIASPATLGITFLTLSRICPEYGGITLQKQVFCNVALLLF